MPVRKLAAEDVPQRKYSSFLTHTPEWVSAIQALEAGLNPHEALEIKLSPALQRKSRWVYRSLAGNFRKHVQRNNIPVEVRFYNDKEMSNQAVYLIAPGSSGTNHQVPPVRRRGPGRPRQTSAA